MALTPSPEVSPPVIMRQSDLGLISWSSHLLLRCLPLSSWDGLILDSYHGPHTFSWAVFACRHETVFNLGSYRGPHTFHLRCLCSSLCDGLNLGLYHGPHTFCLRCLRSSSYDGLNLGSYCGPHTFCLRCLCSSSYDLIRLYWGWLLWLQDSLPPCRIGRDHCHWSHRKRELRCTLRNLPSHFLCLELLCLSAW